MNLMEKLTVRLTPNQIQVLTELKDLYHCSYSLLVRTIIGSWLATNESIIDLALTKHEDNPGLFDGDIDDFESDIEDPTNYCIE